MAKEIQPKVTPKFTPDALREARAALNMTQQDAAVAIEVSISTFQHWEQGRYQPRAVKNVRAVQALIDGAARARGDNPC